MSFKKISLANDFKFLLIYMSLSPEVRKQTMSDPFADLLSSFKGGKESDSKNATKNSSLNDLLSYKSSQTSLNPRAQTQQIRSSTPTENASMDFLDNLLGLSSSKGCDKTETGASSAEVMQKDDFDIAFESLNEHNRVSKPEQLDDSVVDEVKDMEIAQLMSLGISFPLAMKYYENGMLYDDIVEEQQQQRQRQRQKPTSPPEESTNHRKPFQRNEPETSDFVSMASNLFNAGKNFLEEKLAPKERFDYSRNSYVNNTTTSSDQNSSPSVSRFNDCLGDLGALSINDRSNNEYDKQFLGMASKDNKNIAVQAAKTNNQQHSQRLAKGKDLFESNSSMVNHSAKDETLLDFDSEIDTESVANSKHNISNFELSSFNEFKGKGLNFFQSGDYHNALLEFEKSLNSLPMNHPLRIISLSNIISCQLKLGENSKALISVKTALELLGENKDSSLVIEKSSPERSFKQMTAKIQTKHAEIQEHLENYKKALELYLELIASNIVGPKIMEGKRRCEKIVYPEKFKPKPVAKDDSEATTNTVSPKVSATVDKVKKENQKQELEELERFKLAS